METVIVALCVTAALVYMGRTMYLRMTRKGGGCGCGCGGCDSRSPNPGARPGETPDPPACCGADRHGRRG
ncbi:MAG: FeoB-associated Cys-rich membrane protein [Desulfovibrionaceae bacterium]|nr:FeoB-associated Cys-rich membrane protein [Desulfovibrionaceae bacterium]